MIQLTKLTADYIHILDSKDNATKVHRQHYEQWCLNTGRWHPQYWEHYYINDLDFQADMGRYIASHKDLGYIANIKNELT